ncbi:hypothetical protein GEV29_14435 [Aeromicrobium sp. SMF47]|uniref:hypothetical protein n=1 Tax=Aeromicrobium yanjiei TaxID=2662028 RepID=UPI00129E1457|nr:hypothetical protein [Aeromicrobium yanjiei]MRJ77739.1 hypothetical protein [Aeromicrobium yanjiei]
MRWWRGVDLRAAVVPAWCALLTLAIAAPWLRAGHILSYDMVWVPELDLDRPEVWGLGSGLPRAVPSDAVAALLGAALPAALVQRLFLMGSLFLLALGMARLLRHRHLVGQLAAATFAVWNPYVAERLVLGQWPVIVALAAFPWLIGTLVSRDGPRWSVVTIALAATALSPVTGVMGLVLALAVGRRNGVVRIVGLAALVNAPWIVSGLLHASIARTDPAAVRLFDVQGEGSFGRLGSALTLGGIWNTEVVPTSRTLLLAVLIGLVLAAVMVVGLVTMWRDDRALLGGLAAAGAIGIVVALSGWLAPGTVARIVGDVPGGGIVRDGTRWLALLVPLEAVALGVGAHTALGRARHTSWEVPTIVLALLVPLAALPDIAWGVGGRLEPTTYPAAWSDARRVIDKTSTPGDVLVLPFTAYRAPAWNDRTPVLDPAGRFFGRTTVTNDELDVSGRPIAGEDPRARRIGRILADGRDVPRRLARAGIGIVVIETDVPGAEAAAKPFADSRTIPVGGTGLRVVALDGARPATIDSRDRTIMTVTWSLAGLTILLALIGLLRSLAGRLDRKPAEHRPRQVTQP